MGIVELIAKKRDGMAFSEGEVTGLVEDYTAGRLPDYQMSALLMAVFLRGMTPREARALTGAMMVSGKTLDLGDLPGPKVDKHSTGGVGDKTSLIVAPWAAAAGAYVPMISGRALGFTGGTLDKLESIPGFNAHLTLHELRTIVRKVGCVMTGQTEEIAPADRKLYALRDVTATVECIPLICASIMSKKLAEGLNGLVLDVKMGNGSFMQTLEQASELAQNLADIGNGMGTRTVAFITDMTQPLGVAVGNALEVREAIETLKGSGPSDLLRLCEKITARMLFLGGTNCHPAGTKEKLQKLMRSGQVLEKFRQLLEAQGGDPRVIDDYSRLPQAAYRQEISSPQAGFVVEIDARGIGVASMRLGAGRQAVDAAVDPSVGVVLHKKIGDPVEKSEPLCTVHFNQLSKFEAVQELLSKAVRVSSVAVEPPSLIKRILG